MAQDTCTIGTIDKSTLAEGFVTVPTTLSIGGQTYTQTFISNNIDPASVKADVTSQAEVFKSNVTSTGVTPTTTLDNLDGEVISL